MNDQTHYTIVSADCHAGADLLDYRPYLPAACLDEFDRWAEHYENPFHDLDEAGRERNWDSAVRQRDLEADGIVAEVVFPNTVPPFFPSAALAAYPPKTTGEHELRLEGLRAHNRWLAEWCGALPGRRAGLGQVFLNDIDAAIEDVTWSADNDLEGILLPGVPPDLGIPPLWSDHYDPLWSACQDLDLTVTQHGGSGLPDLSEAKAHNFLMLMEVPFFAHRSLWHLVLGGVFERFPALRFVMTEQRVDWVPPVLRRMDVFWHRMTTAGSVGEMPADAELLPNRPSSYFHRNCWIGSSFPSPSEAAAIREVGADRIMWGSDYPHSEGTCPHTSEAIRHSFADWGVDVMRPLLGATAADVYGFDLEWLSTLGIGPEVNAMAEPLAETPQSTSLAFSPV